MTLTPAKDPLRQVLWGDAETADKQYWKMKHSAFPMKQLTPINIPGGYEERRLKLHIEVTDVSHLRIPTIHTGF